MYGPHKRIVQHMSAGGVIVETGSLWFKLLDKDGGYVGWARARTISEMYDAGLLSRIGEPRWTLTDHAIAKAAKFFNPRKQK